MNYREVIKFVPNFVEAHGNLGVVLKKLGKFEEAEASFRQVIELKPNSAEAYSNLGNTLSELGRLEEAETNYSKRLN